MGTWCLKPQDGLGSAGARTEKQSRAESEDVPGSKPHWEGESRGRDDSQERVVSARCITHACAKHRDGVCADGDVPGGPGEVEVGREGGRRQSQAVKTLASATVGDSSGEKMESEAAAGGRREVQTRSVRFFV